MTFFIMIIGIHQQQQQYKQILIKTEEAPVVLSQREHSLWTVEEDEYFCPSSSNRATEMPLH